MPTSLKHSGFDVSGIVNLFVAVSDSEQHPNPVLSRDLSVTM